MTKDYFLVIYLDETKFQCAAKHIKNIENFQLEESEGIFDRVVIAYCKRIKQIIVDNEDKIKRTLALKTLSIKDIFDFDADETSVKLILNMTCDELEDFTDFTKVISNLIEGTALEQIGEFEVDDNIVDYSFSLIPTYIGVYESEIEY